MDDILERIKQAVDDCYWRKDVHGTSICRGHCGPCERIIDIGKCSTIQEIFNKKEN